jgi:hypothetical protein
LKQDIDELVVGIARRGPCARYLNAETRCRTRVDIAASKGISVDPRPVKKTINLCWSTGHRISTDDPGVAKNVIERSILKHQHKNMLDGPRGCTRRRRNQRFGQAASAEQRRAGC